jgi:hypothetical protein
MQHTKGVVQSSQGSRDGCGTNRRRRPSPPTHVHGKSTESAAGMRLLQATQRVAKRREASEKLACVQANEWLTCAPPAQVAGRGLRLDTKAPILTPPQPPRYRTQHLERVPQRRLQQALGRGVEQLHVRAVACKLAQHVLALQGGPCAQ